MNQEEKGTVLEPMREAAQLLADRIRHHQYGLRGFGDGSLSRGRNLTDDENALISDALDALAAQQRAETTPEPTRTREQHIALREGYAYDAEWRYFEPRPVEDGAMQRKAFGAGFDRGFDSGYASAATPPERAETPPEPPVGFMLSNEAIDRMCAQRFAREHGGSSALWAANWTANEWVRGAMRDAFMAGQIGAAPPERAK